MSTIETALDKFQSGDFGGTAEICKRLIALKPDDAFVRGLLGNALSCLNLHDEAISELLKALETDSNQSRAHHNLGAALQAAGRVNEACEHFNRAHTNDPSSVESLVCLAMARRDLEQWQDAKNALELLREPLKVDASYWLEFGKVCVACLAFDEALSCFRQVQHLAPNAPGLDYQFGLVHLSQDRYKEAAQSFKAESKKNPAEFQPRMMTAFCLAQQDEFESVLSELREAIPLAPNNVQAYNMKGFAHYRLGQPEAAKAAYAKAYKLGPDDPLLLRNIAELMISIRDFQGAQKQLSRVIEKNPEHLEALISMAGLQHFLGNHDGVIEYFNRAQLLHPTPILEASSDLLLPYIMGTEADILESRNHFSAMLEKWRDRKPSFQLPHHFFGTSNFFLAYHGLNDKPLLEQFSKLCAESCPSLLYTAPHCERSPQSSRLRVGFLSRFLYNHSVATSYSEIARSLSLTGEFEIHLISDSLPTEAELSSTYPGFVGKTIRISGNHDSALRTIAALELDILVYLDIGMVPSTYFLAHARLARSQCVLGGHPVTTGIPNMDYFISSTLMEVAEADSHYSETLIRLPFSPFYFKRPAAFAAPGSPTEFKAKFGIPAHSRIYMCPAKLQKIHPGFDHAMGMLLDRDEEARVILFEDQHCSVWTKQLQRRFEKTIQSRARERIQFIPWQTTMDGFTGSLAAADALLEPFHFGLGTTAIPCYAMGQPIVTLPGEFMRSRPIAFCSKVLGIEECIASDIESYVETCIELASNPDFKQSLRKRISENDHEFFDNPRPMQQMADMFHKIAGR